MTDHIELTNNGTNIIHYGKEKEAFFAPKKTIKFPKEIAERLLALYPDTLSKTQEAVVTPFVGDDKRTTGNRNNK